MKQIKPDTIHISKSRTVQAYPNLLKEDVEKLLVQTVVEQSEKFSYEEKFNSLLKLLTSTYFYNPDNYTVKTIDSINEGTTGIRVYSARPLVKPEDWSNFEINPRIRTYIESLLSNSVTFESFKKRINHKPNKKKFLKAAKKLFGNLDAYGLGTSLTTLRRFIENIEFNAGITGAKPQGTIFYQYSTKGGVGKNVFIDRLQNFIGEDFMSTGNVKGRWIGAEFSKCLVNYDSEFFPPKNNYNSEKETTITTINNIADNVKYMVEGKGKQPISVQSNSTLVLNSNRMPYDNNARRWGIVRYNEHPLNNKKFTDEEVEYLHPDWSIEQWNQVIQDLFDSCPFGEDFENLVKPVDSFTNDTILRLKNAIYDEYGNIKNVPHYINSATCFQIAEWVVRAENQGSCSDLNRDRRYLKEQLVYLVLGLDNIDKYITQRVNGTLEYSRYNWLELAENEKTSYDIQTTSVDELPTDLQRTAAAFDWYISQCEDDDTPDGTDDDSEEIVEESVEEPVEDIFATILTDDFVNSELQYAKVLEQENNYSLATYATSINNQFIVAAEFKEGCIQPGQELRRKKENMRPTRFVFECDENDITEQRIAINEVYKNFKDNIFSITYSGGKSIHLLIEIAEKDRDEVAKDVKWYWKEVSKIIFNDRVKADEACANITRLTRRPNGLRENGVKQDCYYLNVEAQGFDLTELIEEHKKIEAIKAIEKAAEEARRKTYVANSENSLLQQLENIVTKRQSPSGLLALEILQSGCAASGSDMIGAIGYLRGLSKLDTKWYELGQELVDICHSQHPSNITFSNF